MKRILRFVPALLFFIACSKGEDGSITPPPQAPNQPVQEAVYDENRMLFTSCNKLVMEDYEGWFAAQGDACERGWYRYQNGNCGGFMPGCSSVDF